MNPTTNQTPNPFNHQLPKTDAKYILKCILGALFIVTGVLSVIFDHPAIGGIMRIAAGLILFPPSLEAFERQFNTKLNRAGKYIVIIALIILSGIVTNDKSQKSETATITGKDNTEQAYSDYFNQQLEVINSLSAKKTAVRRDALNEMQNSIIYKQYSSNISAQYLPVLNALGECIRTSSDTTFYTTDETEKELGKEKFQLVLNYMALFYNGGFTKDIVQVFDAYLEKFGYYGLGGSNGFDENGHQTDYIKNNYNLTPIFAVFDKNNKKLANSIYEVHSKGIVDWEKVNTNSHFAFLSERMAYNNYLKGVDPDSPYILNYDYELTAQDLYAAYNANEVAADEKYKGKKLLVTGVVESINKNGFDDIYVVLDVDGYFKSIHCAIQNEKAAAKLYKGNQYVFLGTCTGLFMQSVFLKNCTIQSD
jgi:hypothetical protein